MYKPLSATEDDFAPDSPIDVEDDVDVGSDVGEGVANRVAVTVTLAACEEGEDGGCGGEGSCSFRTDWNGGGIILTIAHFSVNQSEVEMKKAVVQFREKQGTARKKNPLAGAHTQVHYPSVLYKPYMI